MGQQVPDGIHELMVAQAGAHYPGGVILPEGYSNAKAGNKTGGGQTEGPRIKWIDDGKPLFALKILRHSTVLTTNSKLQFFFESCSKNDDTTLVAAIKSLRLITVPGNTNPLHRHIAVIFNQVVISPSFAPKRTRILAHPCKTLILHVVCLQVLHMLAQRSALPSKSKQVDTVALELVKFMIYAVHAIHNESRGTANRPPVLRTYIHYVFRSAAPGAETTVHSQLVKYLAEVMTEDHGTARDVQESYLLRSWFFFGIISKSMGQAMVASRGTRSKMFPPTFSRDLTSLVRLTAESVADLVEANHTATSAATHNLAYFMHSCFAVMNRGVVFELLQHFRDVVQDNEQKWRAAKPALADLLVMCRLDFLRIACQYEHYIPLNLPLDRGPEKGAAGLTQMFRRAHCLVGLLLEDVREMLTKPNPEHLRQRSVASLRVMLAKHDDDPRYATSEKRARIAMLYFPLLHLILEIYKKIDVGRNSSGGLQRLDETEDRLTVAVSRDLLFCFLWVIQNVEQQLLTTWWRNGCPPVDGGWEGLPAQSTSSRVMQVLESCLFAFQYRGKDCILDEATNAAVPATPMGKMHLLEEEYNQVGSPRFSVAARPRAATLGTPNRLASLQSSEDSGTPTGWGVGAGVGTLVGQGGRSSPFQFDGGGGSASATPQGKESRARAFSTLVPNRQSTLNRESSGQTQTSGQDVSSSQTLRKYRMSTLAPGSSNAVTIDTETVVTLEQHQASEVALVVLRTLNIFVGNFEDFITDRNEARMGQSSLAWQTFSLINRCFQIGLSDRTLPHLFQTIWSLVLGKKTVYAEILFQTGESYLENLCLELIKGCKSEFAVLRDHSCVLLFELMKRNLKQMSLVMTITLSKTAGEGAAIKDRYLRASLESIALYAESDPDPVFTRGVKDLMQRLRQVLHDTSEIVKFEKQNDEEMLVDLHVRIAESYANQPALRYTWLEKIAKRHINRQNWSEAGMAICHCAALICESLKGQLNKPEIEGCSLNAGCEALIGISPNLLHERDLMKKVIHVADDDYAMQSSNAFSERGVVHILERAIDYFKQAKRYELVSKLYLLMFPILERDHKYEKLAAVCKDMHTCFEQISEKSTAGTRPLGTYYRVKFWGKLFGDDLRDSEFIYREPDVTPLAVISRRLQDMYTPRAAAGMLEMIMDSKEVSSDDLDDHVAYIQVTVVQPVFSDKGVDMRSSYFEQNHDICKFVLETPFTKGGKAHGTAETQCKRVTVLSVEEGLSFPYIKRRLKVFLLHISTNITFYHPPQPCIQYIITAALLL